MSTLPRKNLDEMIRVNPTSRNIMVSHHSKRTPTYPWNKQFMKEFLSFGAAWRCLGYVPGVCWKFLRTISVPARENGEIMALASGWWGSWEVLPGDGIMFIHKDDY